MTIGLASALDEARYVRVSDDGLTVAVWHGGPYVNVYAVGADEWLPVDTLYVDGDEERAVVRATEAVTGVGENECE